MLSESVPEVAWARREVLGQFETFGIALPDRGRPNTWDFHDLESFLNQVACLFASCPSLAVHAMSSMDPAMVQHLRSRIRIILRANESSRSTVCTTSV